MLHPFILISLLLYGAGFSLAGPETTNHGTRYRRRDLRDLHASSGLHRQVDQPGSVILPRHQPGFARSSQMKENSWRLLPREAKGKSKPPANKPAAAPPQKKAPPAAKPKSASPPPKKASSPKPSKAEQKAQANQKKAASKAAANEKKAKAQAAKDAKKKAKDQKLVSDNLKLETKGQNKAAAAAQKNLQKIQNNYNKNIDKENGRLAKDQRNANNRLAKAQANFNKQQGKKGAKKAMKELDKARGNTGKVDSEHNKRLDKLRGNTGKDVAKNSRGLEKGIAKSHSDNFDKNGKAKVHLSTWGKFKKVAKTIAIEGAIALGTSALALIPGAQGAAAGITAARVAVQAGVRAGVQVAKTAVQQGVKQIVSMGVKGVAKQVGKKLIKDGIKKGVEKGKDAVVNKIAGKKGQQAAEPQPVPDGPAGWSYQNADQVAASQKNKDLHVNSLNKANNDFLSKINKNRGAKVRKRDLMQLIYPRLLRWYNE